jgi:hypothetical protein
LGKSHVAKKNIVIWFATHQPAAVIANGSAGAKAEDGFKSAFSMPQLLGDCGTGRNDVCCSILINRKQNPGNFVCVNMEKMKNRLIFYNGHSTDTHFCGNSNT